MVNEKFPTNMQFKATPKMVQVEPGHITPID